MSSAALSFELVSSHLIC